MKERTPRRPDSIIQTRIDRRDLAIIAKFLESKGQAVLTRSALARSAIELLADILIQNGAEDFSTTHDATRYLEILFPDGLNPSGRGRATLMKNLQADLKEIQPRSSYQQLEVEAEIKKAVEEFKDE